MIIANSQPSRFLLWTEQIGPGFEWPRVKAASMGPECSVTVVKDLDLFPAFLICWREITYTFVGPHSSTVKFKLFIKLRLMYLKVYT